MKKHSIILIAALTLILTAFALPALALADEGQPELIKDSITIGIGESAELFDLIADGDKDDGDYSYSTEDSGVIEVADGTVKGLSTGTGEVAVSRTYKKTDTTDEHTETSVLTVTVDTAPEQIAFSAKNIIIGLNSTYDLDSVTKGGYSYSRVYTSLNSEVAEIDGTGKVIPNSIGTATMTVTSYNGMTDTCTVTVVKTQPKLIITSKNTLIQKGANIHKTLYKLTGLTANVRFQSANSKIASIDKNGYVTGVKKGKTTVKVLTDYDNICASQAITVIDDALPLNYNSAQIALDQAHVTRVQYGTSAQGRILEAYIIENKTNRKYKKTLFIDFAVHGFEDDYAHDGKKLVEEANKLIKYFTFHSDLLNNYRLVIVPCANPDGTIAGKNNLRACKTAFGRCTSKHIDMNRDFISFKAVESRKLRDFIKKCKPNVYLNMHGWLNESIGNKKLCGIINKQQGFKKYIASYAVDKGYIIGWVYKNLKIPAALVEYKSPKSINQTKDVNMIKAIIKAYK